MGELKPNNDGETPPRKEEKYSFLYTCKAFLVFLPATLGLLLFGFQVYGYLYSGEWWSLSLANFIGFFYHDWSANILGEYNPKTWVGLYNLLDFIPLWLSLIIVTIWLLNVFEEN